MSNNNHRHRERTRPTDSEVAQEYGVTEAQAAAWRRDGARITRGAAGLVEWSPAYPVPAGVHRTGPRRVR